MFLILFTEEEVRIVYVNGKKKHQRPESFSVIGNGNVIKQIVFINIKKVR